jgi:hypothetical protein
MNRCEDAAADEPKADIGIRPKMMKKGYHRLPVICMQAMRKGSHFHVFVSYRTLIAPIV